MNRKLLWAVVALLALTVTVLIAAWPRYLPAPYCYPETVFTAEDLRARVNCHPNKYKIEINRDTVVLFAFRSSVDWVGPIFVIHVPSVSEVVLVTDGSIRFESYKSPEGRSAIEDVLNDPELMASILERAKEIEERMRR
jgi:hypothetical protein